MLLRKYLWLQRKEAIKFMKLEKNDIVIMSAGFKTDRNSHEIPKTNLMKIEVI